MSQTIKWENSCKNLCVICSALIVQSSYFVCEYCNQICKIMPTNVIKTEQDKKYVVLDIKSRCCMSDVKVNLSQTCSDKCHVELVKRMENDFGKFKKVVDEVTGLEYKVPTKDLIEKGLSHDELQSYPTW